MDYKRFGDTLVLRLDPGEEVMAELLALAKAEGIHLATIQGLGACREVDLALYDVEEQAFRRSSYTEALEMTSLDGNYSEMGGEPYLHVHANFGRADQTVIGGHLVRAVISGTAELFIRLLDGRVDRTKSAETGLNVFSFEP